MAKASIARRQNLIPGPNEAGCESTPDVPHRADWRGEARRALASESLSIDGDGRIVRNGAAPTGFVLDPLISGRQVYVRDECGTRYWLGSPNRLRVVMRWLLS